MLLQEMGTDVHVANLNGYYSTTRPMDGPGTVDAVYTWLYSIGCRPDWLVLTGSAVIISSMVSYFRPHRPGRFHLGHNYPRPLHLSCRRPTILPQCLLPHTTPLPPLPMQSSPPPLLEISASSRAMSREPLGSGGQPLASQGILRFDSKGMP